ncbi:hypothetical protein [Niabella hibiscisoli]|uniref:hypothetical protein n=1 Tax=Niabella hibiscisoli TaxID=1825928 RepID=UPI001F0D51F0|nr:hypothetical protein [Niabella hibiscisoli]MCH5715974.1 hypothetical protein [Niabella hibiscisoli]
MLFCSTRKSSASGQPSRFGLPLCLFPERGNARTGLAFAWSNDGFSWNAIGPEHYFVYSDYGTWGAQKKMLKPFLFAGGGGTWHLVWSLNATENVWAHAASPDLVYWGRQSYPQTAPGSNVIEPVISSATGGAYTVSWQSNTNNKNEAFSLSTNFKTFPSAQKGLAGSIVTIALKQLF